MRERKVTMGTVVIVVAILLVLRDIFAYIFGWGDGETFVDLLENAAHNRKIDAE